MTPFIPGVMKMRNQNIQNLLPQYRNQEEKGGLDATKAFPIAETQRTIGGDCGQFQNEQQKV